MKKPEGHPLIGLLMQFVDKVLPMYLYEAVSDHVETCSHCQKRIAANCLRPRQKTAA